MVECAKYTDTAGLPVMEIGAVLATLLLANHYFVAVVIEQTVLEIGLPCTGE